MMPDITLTVEEQKAIASLKRLAKKWPISLQLFSWNGSLKVMKYNGVKDCIAAHVEGIRNDGGDPDDDFNQFSEIEYLTEAKANE